MKEKKTPEKTELPLVDEIYLKSDDDVEDFYFSFSFVLTTCEIAGIWDANLGKSTGVDKAIQYFMII